MSTRSYLSATLAVAFVLALPLGAQTAQSKRADPLASYPQRYAMINRELASYRTVTADMESLGIGQRSTDGGKVEASCKGRQTRLIVATDFGEHGSTTTQFYYWNNSLFFVHQVSQRSDALYGPTVERNEDRLYYLDGRLVKWLDSRKVVRSLRTSEAQELNASVSTDAELFYSRLGGCPRDLPQAADIVALVDTSAPQMAPAPETSERAAILETAYLAQMKIDLRSLATFEEQFAADNGGAYFSGRASKRSPLYGFTPSDQVTISVTAVSGSRPNWAATASHARSSKMCVVQNGRVTCE